MLESLKPIFANKLMASNRIDDPLVSFKVSALGGKTCKFLLPEFDFYKQLVIVRETLCIIFDQSYHEV
jgi:hypothetical protein